MADLPQEEVVAAVVSVAVEVAVEDSAVVATTLDLLRDSVWSLRSPTTAKVSSLAWSREMPFPSLPV